MNDNMSVYYVMRENREEDQIEQLSVPFPTEESAINYMELAYSTWKTRLYVMKVIAMKGGS